MRALTLPPTVVDRDPAPTFHPPESAPRERTVLVVGGAGYVGTLVCAELLRQGYHVIVLDPLLYGHDSVANLIDYPGFELHVADTRDEAIVWQLLRRSGSVIHLGEIVGDQACDLDPAVTISVNYTATVGLAEMASSAGVERFIYPSSCSVYGTNDEIVDEDAPLNPLSLYGRLKQASELAILDIRGDTFHPTIFRLATVYGLSPRPRFDLVVNTLAGRAAAEGEIVVQGGGQWRPFVHVADVARVMVGTLKAPLDAVDGEIFNLGSNTQNDTIAGIADIVCSRLPSVALAVTDGMDRRNYRVAFDKIADVLAFQPTRTIDDGVSEIVDAVQGGAIADVRAARHSNVRALIETEARSRLWREDLADGVPANPFRPRDLEEPIPLPIPLHEVREGAVS